MPHSPVSCIISFPRRSNTTSSREQWQELEACLTRGNYLPPWREVLAKRLRTLAAVSSAWLHHWADQLLADH